MVRMPAEARDRVQKLASGLGVSGTNIWRALSFATPDEYSKLERRRVDALSKAQSTSGDTTD